MILPLKGYRILDFTKLLPGPLATRWMAEQGAEVIKIESPSSPDPLRFYPPMHGDVSKFHTAMNAGKKSLAVDYRSEEGLAQILKLVETADVVIEGFRPGTMAAFGLGYEHLIARNSMIILVSITGYGQNGGMSTVPGHDINYLAYSGMLDGFRDSSGNPIMPASQIADVAGGSMAALNATTAALLHRERTGEGQHANVSMTHCVSVLQSLRIAEEAVTGKNESFLSGRLASYNVYSCADGKHIALGALEPKFWQKFCELVEKPEWINRLFEEELKVEVQALFNTKQQHFWTEKLEDKGVCFSPVLSVQEAMSHPLFNDGFPPKLGGADLSKAPELGADNDQFLADQ